ncbi:MAG: hypothetical protein LBE33_05195 [Zoogloeaceae bacterium]|jgi:predicted RNA-binding Zn-ribbon protein involved in translation (DUF1610 family)|nr:hypothetical protein [Zoogloeaceae bacterium]
MAKPCPACGKPIGILKHYAAPARHANIFPCPHCGRQVVFGGYMGVRLLQIVSFIGLAAYALSTGNSDIGWIALGLIAGLEIFFILTSKPQLIPTSTDPR